MYRDLDGAFIDARWNLTVENVSAAATRGIGPDKHRELLGVHAGAQESGPSWPNYPARSVR